MRHWHKYVCIKFSGFRSSDLADVSLVNATTVKAYSENRIGNQLGVDPNTILATSHGRRSIDTLKLYDPSLATWDCQLTHGIRGLW